MTPPADPKADLRPWLLPGERILWAGAPHRSGPTRAGIFNFLFSCFFLAFALFWTFASYAMSGDIWFSAFGIPFILVGLYMLCVRPILVRRTRATTLYGVTDRRILSLERLFGPRLVSLEIDRLPALVLEEGRDRRGTIRFSEPPRVEPPRAEPIAGDRRGTRVYESLTPIAAFENIADVRTVYDLIRRQAEAARVS